MSEMTSVFTSLDYRPPHPAPAGTGGWSRVAFKVQLPPSQTELVKLEEEAKLQQKACGDFVLRCEASFRIGLHFCMLTELCPGGELGEWLKVMSDKANCDGTPPPDIWRVITECIEGLVHVHSKLVVHRDLKPQVRLP